MKKAVYGKCHICGEYGELSFEHIPPQAALNKGQVKAYSGEEILKTFHGERAISEYAAWYGEVFSLQELQQHDRAMVCGNILPSCQGSCK